MKKNLLVTLADENYVDQAKQLFSSVYWNAGWKGDYMLLAHEIPEKKLKWFRDKGIPIKKCKPFFKIKNEKFGRWPITVFSKLYLFDPEFKRWKNIVYLDSDIIVRASLDRLTKINGFGAVTNLINSSLKDHLVKTDKDIYNRLKKEYGLRGETFNSGMLAFNTDIIKRDTFNKLKKLMRIYGKISKFPDGLIMNLFFYEKFIKLPYVYNCHVNTMIKFCNIKPEKIKSIILHFDGKSNPWFTSNPFYLEWKSNLNKADQIDLKKNPSTKKKWSNNDIKKYSNNLKGKSKFYFINHTLWKIWIFFDKCIGLGGISLKKYYPKLYFKLKKLKDEKATFCFNSNLHTK